MHRRSLETPLLLLESLIIIITTNFRIGSRMHLLEMRWYQEDSYFCTPNSALLLNVLSTSIELRHNWYSGNFTVIGVETAPRFGPWELYILVIVVQGGRGWGPEVASEESDLRVCRCHILEDAFNICSVHIWSRIAQWEMKVASTDPQPEGRKALRHSVSAAHWL